MTERTTLVAQGSEVFTTAQDCNGPPGKESQPAMMKSATQIWFDLFIQLTFFTLGDPDEVGIDPKVDVTGYQAGGG